MGQEGLLRDLRKELAEKKVLVVVGTGVSIQASGGDPRASWDGLILDGIKYAAEHNLLPDDKAETLRKKLKKSRLKVAEELSKIMRDGDLRRWLREAVGKLPLKDASIIEAVHAIGAPLATTNYDDLLSRGRGIEAVPWIDVKEARELLRGERCGVLHFHGYYDVPNSVVLEVRSYRKLLDSRGAQAIQQAVTTLHTLLFIGCGDGLADPNFGALLKWSTEVFSDSTHYALFRAGEARPDAPQVKFVEYGADYNELAPFIWRELVVARSPERGTALPAAGFCVGRESEVNTLVGALLDWQKVPILGGPGMGKTTIALAALHDDRVAAHFGPRRYFVRLDGAKTRAEVVAAVGLTLGVSIGPTAERDVFDALAALPAALVLDNAETPLDGDQKEVEALFEALSAIDHLALIVTIRGMERPHSVAWAETVKARKLVEESASEAFVRWSGQPAFKNDPYLSKLLGALDGVPLAITLMARFAELFESLDVVWQRWAEKRTAMLKDRASGAGRLHDIAVSYELSIGILSDPARRLLSVLALLPDGAAHEDLTSIFAEANEAADELRRRALVSDEKNRLRMLAPLREYVADVHPPKPADEEHAIRYYLSLAADKGQAVGTVGGAEAIARLAPEVANMESALTLKWNEQPEALWAAVHGWGTFMRFTGIGSVSPIEGVMSAASAAGNVRLIARCALSLGHIAFRRSDQELARKRYEEALALYRQVSDVLGEANCIQCLGDIAARRSYEEEATKRYEEALPLYRTIGDALGEANCIRSLGDLALVRSDYKRAKERYEEALPLCRKDGDVLGEANCIHCLGTIALRWSEYARASERFEEALTLFRRVGSALGEANAIVGLGKIAFVQSDYESARKRHEDALPLFRKVGSVLGEAGCVVGLGDIAREVGNTGRALEQYRAALMLFERIPDPYSIGLTYQRVVRLTQGAEREANLAAACAAWTSIGRDDLVAKLRAEFGVE